MSPWAWLSAASSCMMRENRELTEAPGEIIILWFIFGACCLAVFAAMAILIYAFASNWRFAMVAASGYAAPALPFTGFSIPLDSMGEYVRAFSHCLPITWLLQGQAQVWTPEQI